MFAGHIKPISVGDNQKSMMLSVYPNGSVLEVPIGKFTRMYTALYISKFGPHFCVYTVHIYIHILNIYIYCIYKHKQYSQRLIGCVYYELLHHEPVAI